MAGRYEIWLTDDRGVRLEILDDILGASFVKEVNAIAPGTIGVPRTFDTSQLAVDRMIQVWRAPAGGRLSLWQAYLVRRWLFEGIGSNERLTIFGQSPNDLLRRRIVAAYTGSAQAQKTDFCDDMMKAIVTEALANGIAPTPTAGTRVWPNLSVQADVGLGPTLSKSFSFDRLLLPSGGGVLANLAEAAREAGTEVFFDVQADNVTSSAITFQFRTFTGQPGRDVTPQGVLFSQEYGNLESPSLDFDYTEEINYAYGTGQGAGAARVVQQVSDAARYNASQWNRCEGEADARDQALVNGVREAARALVDLGRPKQRFSAVLLDTGDTQFGVNWNWGDKVRARYRGFEFDSIVRAVTIRLDRSGGETIAARADYES